MSVSQDQITEDEERLHFLKFISEIETPSEADQEEIAKLEAAGVTPKNRWEAAQPRPEEKFRFPGSPYVHSVICEDLNLQRIQDRHIENARRRQPLLLEYFFERRDKVFVEVANLDRPRVSRGWPLVQDDAHLGIFIDLSLLGGLSQHSPVYCLPRKGKDPITVRGWGRVYASIVNPQSQTLRVLELDIDGPNHQNGFADPVSIVRTITDAFTKRNLPHYIQSSKSGRGFHVLIFCQPGTACSVGCRALKALVSDLPLPDADKKRIERFPAKERVEGDQPTVSLPWSMLRNPGCDTFARFGSNNLVEYEPDSLTRISPEQLQGLSDSLPQPDPVVEFREEESRKMVNQTWEEFKEGTCAALSISDLRSIYPIAEVAADDDGWITCRDPRSPSGDATPSAGVAFNNPDFPNGFFHSFCANSHGYCASLNIFDYLMESAAHPDICSFIDAAKYLSDITGVLLPEQVKHFKKPVVIVNRQFAEQEAQTWSALKGNEDLYIYGGRLSIRQGGEIHMLNKGRLRHLCAQSADFISQRKDLISPVNPPDCLLATMLAEPCPEIRRVDHISRIPVFTRDWKLLDTTSYHPDEGILLDLGDLGNIDLPARPSVADVERAYAWFFGPDGVYQDFPISGDAARANLVAMHLSPFIQTALGSLIPCFVLHAGQIASGKTLVPKVWNTLIEGKPSQHIPFPSNDDELEKKVASVAKSGGRTVIMDNLPRHIISSPKLADFLTADRLLFRLLGTNDLLDFPNELIWVLTGNNPLLSDELARRCISIKLEPFFQTMNVDRKFRYPDILASAFALRREVVGAILTLIKFWVHAGCPKWTGRPLPSFERWSQVCGGILEVCGIPGFLENRDDLNAVADADSCEWEQFFTYWWTKYSKNARTETEPVTARLLLDEVLLPERGILSSVLDEKELIAESRSKNARKLNWTLQRKDGSVHNGLRLTARQLERTSEINKFGARKVFVLQRIPNLTMEPLRWERPQPRGVMPSLQICNS